MSALSLVTVYVMLHKSEMTADINRGNYLLRKDIQDGKDNCMITFNWSKKIQLGEKLQIPLIRIKKL